MGGATAIHLHSSDDDRRQLLPEAQLLSSHGFGVFMFDWPGHGESGGRVTWAGPSPRPCWARSTGWTIVPKPAHRRPYVFAHGLDDGALIKVYSLSARSPRRERPFCFIVACTGCSR